jgi:aspergillopepsin I
LLPQDAVTEYFSQVPSSQPPASQGGTYLVPCDSTKAALPPLTFTFTPPAPKAQLVQPGGSGGLNTKPYNAVIPGNYFIGNPTGKNDGMCQAGLGAVGTGQAWDVILGDVFLMSQLVVFDLGDANGQNDENFPQHGQIGFAPKPSGNGTSSATGSAPSATSS